MTNAKDDHVFAGWLTPVVLIASQKQASGIHVAGRFNFYIDDRNH